MRPLKKDYKRSAKDEGKKGRQNELNDRLMYLIHRRKGKDVTLFTLMKKEIDRGH